MKTAMKALVLAAALTASGCAQTSESPVDLAGDWIGYAILGDGSRADFTMRLAKSEDGYTGTISGTTEAIPEMALRNILVRENRLIGEIDFPTGEGVELIRLDLRYEDDSLEGSYVDPTGDSDIVSFRRQR
jgi:hypothetical protein